MEEQHGAPGRHETDTQRLDRNFNELLQELGDQALVVAD